MPLHADAAFAVPQLKALEQRMSRLERHHGIALPADYPGTPAAAPHQKQLKRDPDEPTISQGAAAAGAANDQARIRGASSAKGQHELCNRPVQADPQPFGQTQMAGQQCMSTVDLIKQLQKRNQEVLNYLQSSQKAATESV